MFMQVTEIKFSEPHIKKKKKCIKIKGGLLKRIKISVRKEEEEVRDGNGG